MQLARSSSWSGRSRWPAGPTRNGFLPLSRKDPVIGATAVNPKTLFEYDVFNRRTAVVDPNAVRTETQYFADTAHLNRVHFVQVVE